MSSKILKRDDQKSTNNEMSVVSVKTPSPGPKI